MRSVANKLWKSVKAWIYIALKGMLHLAGKDCTEEIYETVLQFVKFGIVGLSNNVIFYILYIMFLWLFRKTEILQNKGYLAAQAVAFTISMLWSFQWNNGVVFTLREKEKRSKIKALIKMFISYSFTGLFLNSILLILWVNIVGISELVAPVINLLISVPVNFVINKFWAFKQDIS